VVILTKNSTMGARLRSQTRWDLFS